MIYTIITVFIILTCSPHSVFLDQWRCNCGHRLKNDFSLYYHPRYEYILKYRCGYCPFISSKLGMWYNHKRGALQ